MKKLLAITFVASSLVNGMAQSYIDIARIFYSGTNQNYFENSDSSTRINEMGFDLTLPLVLNSKAAFLTGLIYEETETKLFESEPRQSFSAIGFRIGFSKTYSERWSATYILIPKIASDLKSVTWKDFQIGAIGLWKYTKRENFNYRFGVYVNTEQFGPIIVPLFGLYHQSTDQKFEANLTLPFLADVNWKLHDRVHVGANFNGLVRSYQLSEIPESKEEGYVVKSLNELFSYLRFNLSPSLMIQAKLGYTLGRSYRVFNESDKITVGSILIRVGDDRQQLNTDFSDGLVYQATLVYRFHKSN